ncbi:MAG: TetR family transcriptional regulator, partial [Planctomycetes bacterium]|nr:TetR family transcriptional regulator [Planctomycetota bacterium]
MREDQLARVVQYELASLSDEHFKEIASIRRATSKVFTHVLEKGCAAGDFNVADIDTAVLAITSLGIDVSRWFPTTRHSDPRALADRYTELVLRMVQFGA